MTLPEAFAATAPPLRPPVLFDQSWLDLTFVHWPVRPADVAHLFPAGTRPDVFSDGYTYVALVPFRMHHASIGAAGFVPYFGSFLETNIRLYSLDDAGRHGVLFRSLETERLAVVGLARAALGIPYTWARMSYSRDGEVVQYKSLRRLPRRGLASRLTIGIGDEVAPTPLEVFLTARWGAHTRVAGRTLWVPNEHDAWPLHHAEVLELDDDLLGASGVAVAGDPLRALWSPGVRTRFGRPAVLPR